MNVANSTISNNSVSEWGLGGGIHNNGFLYIYDSTIGNNSTEVDGGGISNYGDLTVVNSAITNNNSYGIWGGPGYGAGINNGGNIAVINSTFSGNVADYGGWNY
jgi:hypothetical protein